MHLPTEVGTHIIIWRMSSLSGDVGAGVNCPIRALERKPIPREEKFIIDRNSYLWKSRYLSGFSYKISYMKKNDR